MTINFTHNPSGAMLSRDRYQALIELCRRHGIFDDITIADLTGIAAQDIAAAQVVLDALA